MEKISVKAKNYLRSHIRMAWRYYSKYRQEIKHETCKCPKCSRSLTVKSVKVDHIDPVGTFKPEDNPYIVRMFADKENFMGLCKPCHAIKTREERRRKCKKPSKS